MKNIKKTMDMLDKNRNLAVCFMSDPGCGKTQMINQWAREHKRNMFTYVLSQMSPTEASGMAMPDNDTKRMMIYDFDSLLDLQDGDILFLDELGNGNPMTVNAMLTIILDRKLPSGRKLADILVVAAANPQGCTMFTPQIKQRFLWVEVSFDSNMWVEYMLNRYPALSKSTAKCIASGIYHEAFERNCWNYITARSAEQLVQMFESTRSTKVLLNDYQSSNEYKGAVRQLGTWANELRTQVIWDLLDARIDCDDASFYDDLVAAENDAEVRSICYEAAEGEYGAAVQEWVTKSELNVPDEAEEQPKTSTKVIYEGVLDV